MLSQNICSTPAIDVATLILDFLQPPQLHVLHSLLLPSHLISTIVNVSTEAKDTAEHLPHLAANSKQTNINNYNNRHDYLFYLLH